MADGHAQSVDKNQLMQRPDGYHDTFGGHYAVNGGGEFVITARF